MSFVKNLALTTLDTISRELSLKEQGSAEQPYRLLNSPMSKDPVGCARVFQGAHAEKLVYIGLTVPMIQLDSHMVFCFTAPESLVPHFTIDAVHAGGSYAFHLDLIPRVDLAVNLSYMQSAYQGLTELFKEAKKIPGLTEAQLSPLQIAVMSPWMLAYRASAEAMDLISGVATQYLQHWLNLYKSDANLASPTSIADIALRDSKHRSILFSREVDPVWLQIERLLGTEQSEELRLLLAGQA